MKTLDPPLDLNGVVAVWLESLLYGIYFCLFLQALKAVILGNKHRRHAAKIFLWASCVLFVVCTAHLVINLYRLMASALWGAPFYDTKHWAVISEITMNAVTTMIANCLMIYRCFIVWARSYKVIIVPSLLVVAVLALAGVVAQEYTTPPASAWVCVGGNMVYVLEFAQNAITTGLIAWNIWMHERSVETMLFAERASLNGVVRIIVESAAIYLVELFILIMLLAADHPAQYILVQAVVPTVGIVFTLLMLRLAARAAGPSEIGTMHTVNFSPPMPMFSTSMDAEAVASRASSAPECRKGGDVARVEYEEFEMDDCKAQLQIVEVATGCHAAPSKYHSSASG